MKTGYVVCTRDQNNYLNESFFAGYRLVSSIADATVYATEEKALAKKNRQSAIEPRLLTTIKIHISD